MVSARLLRTVLGVPSLNDKPSHYRMLGLAELESDSKVIGLVSMYCIQYVERMRDESPSRSFEEILNSLRNSQRILLNPDEKKRYDGQLKRRDPLLRVPAPPDADDDARNWLGVVTQKGMPATAHQFLGLDSSERDLEVIAARFRLCQDTLTSLESVCTGDELPRLHKLLELLPKARRVAERLAKSPKPLPGETRKRKKYASLKGPRSLLWVSVGVFGILISTTLLIQRFFRAKTAAGENGSEWSLFKDQDANGKNGSPVATNDQAGPFPVAGAGENRTPAESPPTQPVAGDPANASDDLAMQPLAPQAGSQTSKTSPGSPGTSKRSSRTARSLRPPTIEEYELNRNLAEHFLAIGAEIRVSTDSRSNYRSPSSRNPATGLPENRFILHTIVLNDDVSATEQDLQRLKECRRLCSLTLGTKYSNDETLKLLEGADECLYELKLSGPGITNDTLRNSQLAPDIASLSLTSSPVDDEVLGEFISQRSLVKLAIQDAESISDGLVSRMPQMPRMAYLSLDGTRVTDAGVTAALAKCPTLLELSLNRTKVTGSFLAQAAQVKTLRTIHLDNTNVTDDLLKPIAQVEKLVDLSLNDTEISDKGLEAMLKLKFLHKVWLRNTNVTPLGVEMLTKFRILFDVYLSPGQFTLNEFALAKKASGVRWEPFPAAEIEAPRHGSVSKAELKQNLEAMKNLIGLGALTKVIDAAKIDAYGGHYFEELYQRPDGKVYRKLPTDPHIVRSVTFLADRLGKLTDASARPIADCKFVHTVIAPIPGFTDTFLSYLDDSIYLTTLDLSNTAITDAGLASLKKSIFLRNVNFEDTKVGEGLTDLFASCRGLKTVKVKNTRLDDAGLREALKCQLTELDVSNTGVTDDNAVHFKNGVFLEKLVLDGTGITGQTISMIPRGRRLQTLSLVSTAIDDTCLDAISGMKGLQRLGLGGSHVTSDGVRKLQNCRELVYLDLRCKKVGDDAAAALALMPTLTELDLSHSQITDAGISALAQSQSIRKLNLVGTQVTRGGLAAMSRMSLRELVLDAERFTQADAKGFRSKIYCEVQRQSTKPPNAPP